MVEQPIAGAACWVHTGRGLLLTDQVRAEVLCQWREALGPDRILVAGAGARAGAAGPTADAVEMARQAAELGADALLCFPPVWARGDDGAIVEHHRALAGVGLPLILFFLYEAAGGVTYSEDCLSRLLDLPGVAGIKMATLDSVMTYQDVAALMAQEHPDRLLITGEDRFLGYSLLLGARSALIGLGAALPAPQAELVSIAAGPVGERWRNLTGAIDDWARILFRQPMEGYIQRMLWAAAESGALPEEAAFDPWRPCMPDTEHEDVRCATRLFISRTSGTA